MTNRWRIPAGSMLAALLLAALGSAQAATITVVAPASDPVFPTDTTVSVEIIADFTDEPTVGGGIGLTFTGPISNPTFTPSAFFTDLDSAFTGFGPDDGSASPSADFEIHFGDFNGFDGVNSLGFLTLDIDNTGTAIVDIENNAVWGGWQNADDFSDIDVTFVDAQFEILPIPLPASVWLFGSAIGLLAGVRRRIVRR